MNEAILHTVFNDQFPFGLVGHHDFFAATEMASHVRLVLAELEPHPYFCRERILAWILRRGAWLYRKGWQDDIRQIRFSVADEKLLTDSVRSAAIEVRNSDYVAAKTDLPLFESELANTDGIRRIDGANMYAAGPTYMLCWWNESLFGYLESHLES